MAETNKQPNSEPAARVPVMKDGKVEDFILRQADRTLLRCPCGCNVFHQPDNRRPDLYACNSCRFEFETEREEA